MAFFHTCVTCWAVIAISAVTDGSNYNSYGMEEETHVYDILDGCDEYTYHGTSSISKSDAALVYSHIKSKYSSGSCQLDFIMEFPSSGDRFFVKAEKMALTSASACLEIWEGSSYSTKLGKYCGDSVFELYTTEPNLRIKLVTSKYTEAAAFRLVVTRITQSCNSSPSDLYFRCDDGNCIGRQLVGDGHENCNDGSDEKDVTGPPCSNNMFSCGSSSGLCIAASSRCDRFQDCPKSFDEENCVYKCPGSSSSGTSSMFECQDGTKCFYSYHRCSTNTMYDYDDECMDGSNNMDCDTCGDYYDSSDNAFMNGFNGYCAVTRSCVVTDKWCDGINDCPGGADEDYNSCHPSIYWYWSAGQLAGVFISFFIFVIIVAVIVAIVHKNCRKQVV